jgi:hypothetical protein
MSLSFPNLVLPSAGLGWQFAKRSKYSTTVQTPKSMRHPASATLQTSVIYELELSFNGLCNQGTAYADDAQYIQDFYEACRGGYGWFLFDPSQYSLANMSVAQVPATGAIPQCNGFFAVGDGVTTSFPLWRSGIPFGATTLTLLELIQNITLLVGIYANGTVVSGSAYTVASLTAPPQGGAWVTFNTAPAAGVVLSWAGNYSYLCKFDEDLLDMNELLYQLWELESLKLETINL